MPDHVFYLFGFSRPGIDGQAIPGIDGRRGVKALPVGDVAALVTELPAEELAPLTNPDGPPAEWLIPRARGHQAALDAAQRQAPVLPVRFGAVFGNAEAVRRHLTERYEAIDRFLGDIADKEEWSVKARLDTARAESHLATADADLAAQFARLPASPGARYFAEKKLRAALAARAKTWAGEAALRARRELVDLATDFSPLRLGADDHPAQPVLWSGAFLVRRDGVTPFLARADALAAELAEAGLALEAHGPWPPFNFCPHLSGGPAA